MANTFPLQIVSMDGLEYDGEAQSITLRAVHGDLAILARHINYCTPIGMGTAKVVMPDGTERKAACIGGMLTMLDGTCRVIPTTWEWDEDIDVARAEHAKKIAQERMEASKDTDRVAYDRAEAKLYSALVRLQTAGNRQYN